MNRCTWIMKDGSVCDQPTNSRVPDNARCLEHLNRAKLIAATHARRLSGLLPTRKTGKRSQRGHGVVTGGGREKK